MSHFPRNPWGGARLPESTEPAGADPLTEMLVIGPVAEAARRWLGGAPDIDLTTAARLLPERIWHSVRGRSAGT